MPARKKASGRSIPEAQRHTLALKLRLRPEVAEELRALAAERGCTLGELVTRLLVERRAA